MICSGNQSNGVIGGGNGNSGDFQTNSTYSLTVNNLTNDITPPAGSGKAYGIQWSLTPASPQSGVTELFSSPNHSVSVLSLGNFAAGIDLDSHGGPNGYGRLLKLDVNGRASATGSGGAAVYGFVSGNSGASGNGSNGSPGHDGYSGGGLTITVGPIQNDQIANNAELSGSGDTTSGIAGIGKGGGGGDGAGGPVEVHATSGMTIQTQGNHSAGIFAQSIGGGGGDAGYAASVALGPTNFALSASVGGTGREGRQRTGRHRHHRGSRLQGAR